MRAGLNDGLRWLIGRGLKLLGGLSERAHRRRIRRHGADQARLRQAYGIAPDEPVRGFGPELQAGLQMRAKAGTRYAQTSGSSARPKRIPYSRRRLRGFARAYIEAFARAYWALPIRRHSLYVLASLEADDSLTNLLLEERGLPPYPVTLQAPYRVQAAPAVRRLVEAYGVTAFRLWILCLANPGVLYCTNPSTLSTFLDAVQADWPAASRLVRHWQAQPEQFEPALRRIAGRLVSRGSDRRLARLAASDAALPLAAWAPAVEAYCCWTGGYVRSFLDRLEHHLPPERYRRIPMYAASTETIETVPHFHATGVAFLPLARGVLYEFLPAEAEDRPEHLLGTAELETGASYTMVVSDAYGLRRYQTGDVFRVRGRVAGLPDLAFERRRGLAFSFTGEKLTGEQLGAVYERLRAAGELPAAAGFPTCLPSHPPGEAVPHYRLVLVTPTPRPPLAGGAALARRADALLSEINGEYAAKRRGGRLGPMRFVQVEVEELAQGLAGPEARATWQSQFKFLPLYPRSWESLTRAAAYEDGALDSKV